MRIRRARIRNRSLRRSPDPDPRRSPVRADPRRLHEQYPRHARGVQHTPRLSQDARTGRQARPQPQEEPAVSHNVKGILLDTLDEPEKLVAYSLTTGDNGLDFIAGKIGKSRGVVQNYWASWQKMGIVESIGVRGGSRARALFDLEEFGIEIPEITLEEEITPKVEEQNE